MTDLTPMAKQYQEIKAKHKDSILFFRLGDFYEMFNDDALIASRELEITLTGRGEGVSRMPMCGIPYHAADAYISRLIAKGFKVAICEQVEDPSKKEGNGLVRREVIKIITPGTVFEPTMLNEKRSNWLAAISFSKNNLGFAVIDASTGEFRATQLTGEDSVSKLKSEIDRLDPSECLIPDIIPPDKKEIVDHLTLKGAALTTYKDIYDPDVASTRLKDHFKVASLGSFGLTDISASLGAAAAIIEYLKDTQKSSLGHVNDIKAYRVGEFMYIDGATQKNLELVQTIRDRSLKGSLLWVLDMTTTAMGARLLRNWILEPLLDAKLIDLRLDAVEELRDSSTLRMELEKELKDIADIERLAGKVSVSSANPRDIVALAYSLEKLPMLKKRLGSAKSKLLKGVSDLPELVDAVKKIRAAIVNDPPVAVTEGGIIRDGYSAELDDLRKISRGGKEWIAELESKERVRTGIKSLKVGYTKVFGYYIEVTNSNLSQVPQDYIRKQTLVNCERFITPELKDRESTILNAQERISELEYSIFCEVRGFVSSFVKDLQLIAKTIARLDVFLSLATAALSNKYCRPEMLKNGSDLIIKDGRHPVVERPIGNFNFVPNDCVLNDESRFLLITGPNMAGKSTYMRQVALISVMAQIGSFVPAAGARLCTVDRIFTRIGAMDDIFSGQSTFMVEMTETANIINNATDRSLIILDEIGRGTSTFDGMSIAASVAEHIHERIKAKTLFATHYHEMTQLAARHHGMVNLNVAVLEKGDQITFLHKIVNGPADRSYGIQVAKLAGLPKNVIDRAKEVYNTLEMVENGVGEKGLGTGDKGIGKRYKGLGTREKGQGRDQIGLF
jgi:DNA mismatch repair protein MutS